MSFHPTIRCQCDRIRVRRSLLLIVLIAARAALCLPAAVNADTTAETGITVTTENTGSFSIAFTGGDPETGSTLVDAAGHAEIPVSAVSGNTATGIVELTWEDTRADGARTPYTISLSATDFKSTVANPNGGVYTIPAANLAITAIRDGAQTPPLPLDTAQTVFTSPATPDAGTTSLPITLELQIPPSSYPTPYSATLMVNVTFTGDNPDE